MSANKFPVPEFDRYALKKLDWCAPEVSSDGPGAGCGSVVVANEPAYCEKFGCQGEKQQVVACALPENPVRISGNSFAWSIQRAVMPDSLEADTCNAIADRKTPRPMNTRLGPEDSISVTADNIYLLIGHQFANPWTGNRIMLDNDWTGSAGRGFRILSASENEINDFHDAVVYFQWNQ